MNHKWKHCATVEEEGMKEDAWGADVVHICLCNFRLMNKDPVRPLLRKLKFSRPHCSKTKNFHSKNVKVQLFWESHKNLRSLPHVYLANVQTMRKIVRIWVAFRDIHIECSKQFKRNSYFYGSGQRGPFWAELKLL